MWFCLFSYLSFSEFGTRRSSYHSRYLLFIYIYRIFLARALLDTTGLWCSRCATWFFFISTGTKTLFPASICNDIVVSESTVTTVISCHFDKTVRFWDMRTESVRATISMLGKVTSLNISRGKVIVYFFSPFRRWRQMALLSLHSFVAAGIF